MKKLKQIKLLLLFVMLPAFILANNREKYNFNSQWLLQIGDIAGAEKTNFNDKSCDTLEDEHKHK